MYSAELLKSSINVVLDFQHASPAIEIYVDGSADFVGSWPRLQAAAGWGFHVVHGGNRQGAGTSCFHSYGPVVLDADCSWYVGADRRTNNSAELTAMIEALEFVLFLHQRGLSAPVDIGYDSKYAADAILGFSRICHNRCLIERGRCLVAAVRRRLTVAFFHIASHKGHVWNERADGLAKLGASGSRPYSPRLEAPPLADCVHRCFDADADFRAYPSFMAPVDDVQAHQVQLARVPAAPPVQVVVGAEQHSPARVRGPKSFKF